jgi:demethylmenaquinone methyltransferase/2-methoxy-6-polyprenyl-1,4-benzoquinol methylase
VNADNAGKYTDFGYERVALGEKQQRVDHVFDSVASRYDVMNDLMSLGIHRLWKRFAVELTQVRAGEQILDLASGTGDLARLMASRVGAEGQVVLSDINAAMLSRGRERLTDHGVAGNVNYALANAERLPFDQGTFDCATIAFGLRNVPDKPRALSAILNALKPGGRLLILEFSKPRDRIFSRIYDQYSFSVLPLLGRIVARDAESYRYLAESIRMHPGQEELKAMMEAAGFSRVRYFDLTGGVVALHRGYKF